MRYVDEQTKSVGANLGAISVLVRRPEPPNRRAQAIIILPRHAVQPSPPGPARRTACAQRQATARANVDPSTGRQRTGCRPIPCLFETRYPQVPVLRPARGYDGRDDGIFDTRRGTGVVDSVVAP